MNREIKGAYAVFLREILRYFHSKERILSTLATPLLFLFVFGIGLGSSVSLRGLSVSYLDFLAPGIVIMAIMFPSTMSGISVIWDKELGFMQEMLVAPVSRLSIFAGKCMGTATTTVIQGILLLGIVILMGVEINLNMVPLMIVLMFITSLMFSSIGVTIGILLKDVESFHLIITFLVQPMFFLSGAFFPINQLPAWIRVFSYIDPMTYSVETMRELMIGTSSFPIHINLGALGGFILLFFMIGSWAFNKHE